MVTLYSPGPNKNPPFLLPSTLAPLFMGMISDYFGHVRYGFYLATGFAVILFVAMLFNYLRDPSMSALQENNPTA